MFIIKSNSFVWNQTFVKQRLNRIPNNLSWMTASFILFYCLQNMLCTKHVYFKYRYTEWIEGTQKSIYNTYHIVQDYWFAVMILYINLLHIEEAIFCQTMLCNCPPSNRNMINNPRILVDSLVIYDCMVLNVNSLKHILCINAHHYLFSHLILASTARYLSYRWI